MATFTIDLLTGNLYLFSGDFNGSGSTPTSGSTYPEVNLYSDLPPAAPYVGKTYLVRSSSGSYILNRKESGLYFSTGAVWRRLGDIPSFFKSDNFQIYDNFDNSKGISFDVSDVTTNTFRSLKVQDSSGTIAYLTDIASKVDLSIFADFTGNTAPNTYLSISNFNTYSGDTLLLIQNKQDILTAGVGINISPSNVISVIISNPLILTDEIGSVNVNNITPTPINWSTQVFSGTSLNFSGGSRIYIEENGVYEVSYILNVNNDSDNSKNIGTVIRKNGDNIITQMSSASYNFNLVNDSSTNMMPEYVLSLNNGDYIELIAFRIGNSGQTYTVNNASWIKVHKIIK